MIGRACFMVFVLTRLLISIIFLDQIGDVLGLPCKVCFSSLDRVSERNLGMSLNKCWISLVGRLSGPEAEFLLSESVALEKSSIVKSCERSW